MLSSHLSIPREGQMQELLHFFAYLKKHMNTEMVFDPSESAIDMNSFHSQYFGPALSTRGNLACACARGAGTPRNVDVDVVDLFSSKIVLG